MNLSSLSNVPCNNVRATKSSIQTKERLRAQVKYQTPHVVMVKAT
jgi:hypothetical protein